MSITQGAAKRYRAALEEIRDGYADGRPMAWAMGVAISALDPEPCNEWAVAARSGVLASPAVPSDAIGQMVRSCTAYLDYGLRCGMQDGHAGPHGQPLDAVSSDAEGGLCGPWITWQGFSTAPGIPGVAGGWLPGCGHPLEWHHEGGWSCLGTLAPDERCPCRRPGAAAGAEKPSGEAGL